MRTPLLWVVGCCVVVAACAGATPSGPTTTPMLSRTRFLAFGDSITAGEVTAPLGRGGASPNVRLIVLPSASYPSQLLSQFHARYSSQAGSIAMTNSGRSGETVLEGRERFPGELAASQADVVLLMEGVSGLPIAGPDISTEVMREMVRHATARTVRVFIGSMVPTIEGRSRSQRPAELVTYNMRLRQMAGEESAVFVDLYSALLAEANTVIGVDGLHPTEVGYKRIADIFFAAIQVNLEVK